MSLTEAVAMGDTNQVQALLSQGADVNQKNRMGWTPLHTAVQKQNKEIAEILDISLDNVKIRLHRARAKLKAILNEACDFY